MALWLVLWVDMGKKYRHISLALKGGDYIPLFVKRGEGRFYGEIFDYNLVLAPIGASSKI
jgi:hypothetical protein